MYPIDVHILRCPDDDLVLYNKMLISLSTEPVNVYEVPGIPGDLLQARKNGYLAGSASYVTLVDPDDEITPGIFTRINSVLEKGNPRFLAVNEEIVNGRESLFVSVHDRISPIGILHHLIVYKREDVANVFGSVDNILGAEVEQAAKHWGAVGCLAYIDTPGYKWNRRANSFSSQDRPVINMRETRNALFSSGARIQVFGEDSFGPDNFTVDEGVLYKIERRAPGRPPTLLVKI